MRAARLLRLLLILQRQGRSTAAALAEALEVSERTILRDVEALSEAGVPVYATRGRGGGIELLDGFQTRLTGVTPEEGACLLLVGQSRLAHRLGLSGPTRTIRTKLLEAIPEEGAKAAEELDAWFLNDPDPPEGHRIPHGELRRLADCIRRRREVELHVADEPVRRVRPLGIVVKAGQWWLVIAVPDLAPAVLPLDELRGTRITRTPFERPPGFDLETFWRSRAATTRPGTG